MRENYFVKEILILSDTDFNKKVNSGDLWVLKLCDFAFNWVLPISTFYFLSNS